MTKKMDIVLCDLFHNYIGMGTYTFPLNIGYVGAYAKKFFKQDINLKLFKFADHFIEHIKKERPDVVGFSHYTWNVDLNLKISRILKRLYPDVITIFGGPNIDFCEAGIRRFFQHNPHADFYIPFQGEMPFVTLLGKIIADNNIDNLKSQPIPGSLFYRGSSDNIIIGEQLPRLKKPDEVPSPYLTGLLDEFFEMKLIPIIETNRGCPYTCTYCAQGFSSQNTMEFFSIDRVKEEVNYIAARVSYTNLLMIADSNFGIHRHDYELALFFKELREKNNYPRKFHFNWAKKNPKIFELGKILQGSSYLIISVQSLDPIALKNIRRVNVDMKTFRKNITEVNEAGGISATEIILGLPGETKQSHLDSLRQLFDWNVSFIVPYNLILLEGTEMSLRQRAEFGLQTKFRLSDGCFGIYDSEYVFDVEEGVIGTDSMSQDDLLWFRKIHWLIWFMWNQRMYYDLMKLFQTYGINPLDFILAVRNTIDKATGQLGIVSHDFDNDTISEWFVSPEALSEYFSKSDNFSQLCDGKLSGKINLKYQWRVLLECHKQFSAVVYETALELRNVYSLDISNDLLAQMVTFLDLSILDFTVDLSELGKERTQSFTYDFLSWRNGNFKNPIQSYFVKDGIHYKFHLPVLQKQALDKIIKQYSHKNKLATYRKMGDYMSFTDLFYSVQVDEVDK